MKHLLAKFSAIRKTIAKETPRPPQTLQAALAHHQAGRLKEAEHLYRQILAHDKISADAQHLLGVIAQQRGHSGEAVRLIRLSLEINPNQPVALNNLGIAYQELGRLDEAETACREALTQNPHYAEAHNNLGNVFRARGLLDKAEACYRTTLELRPDNVQALTNLGNVLQEQGRTNEAEVYCHKACALSPGNAFLHWNLALLLLLRGNYRDGLALYEKRLECGVKGFTGATPLYSRLKNFHRWKGEHLAGKRILVWAEQGFGDYLMVMRYLPMIKDMGVARLIVFCFPTLAHLTRELPGIDEVVVDLDEIPQNGFDLHCPIMSLPLLFRARLDSLPNQVPYLCVPTVLCAAWTGRLHGTKQMRVGLAWSGSAALRDNGRRSISLRQFEPLLAIEGIQLISLQKGAESKELAELGWDIPDLMDDCHDFMDTAALVQNLDLVISVDTAVAHLAGALGKPVWLLNRFESEWRWGLEREDSPWYPTMRIFRQMQESDWDTVIIRVALELERIAAQPSCRYPWG